jgi:hypothetical protein
MRPYAFVVVVVLMLPTSGFAQEIFTDGFESGDLSVWSDAVGELCGFHTGMGCSFAFKTCFMGELLNPAGVDLCHNTPDVDPFPLPEFADCIGAGLTAYDLCGANSVCLDSTPGVYECRDVCATNEGAFGSSPHVDCRRTGAVCIDAFGTPSYGLCF